MFCSDVSLHVLPHTVACVVAGTLGLLGPGPARTHRGFATARDHGRRHWGDFQMARAACQNGAVAARWGLPRHVGVLLGPQSPLDTLCRVAAGQRQGLLAPGVDGLLAACSDTVGNTSG